MEMLASFMHLVPCAVTGADHQIVLPASLDLSESLSDEQDFLDRPQGILLRGKFRKADGRGESECRVRVQDNFVVVGLKREEVPDKALTRELGLDSPDKALGFPMLMPTARLRGAVVWLISIASANGPSERRSRSKAARVSVENVPKDLSPSAIWVLLWPRSHSRSCAENRAASRRRSAVSPRAKSLSSETLADHSALSRSSSAVDSRNSAHTRSANSDRIRVLSPSSSSSMDPILRAGHRIVLGTGVLGPIAPVEIC